MADCTGIYTKGNLHLVYLLCADAVDSFPCSVCSCLRRSSKRVAASFQIEGIKSDDAHWFVQFFVYIVTPLKAICSVN